LAELWCSWGVRPAAVIGQSLGEVAACHVAGILSLDDAMRVVCRSSLQFKHLSGAMLVVEQSADELRSALRASPASIHLAIHTSPRSTVLSGDRAALERLAEVLEKREIFCRFVEVSFAGHSPGVAVIDSVLRRELAGLEPCPATLAMVSTVTSEAIRGPELDAAYWCRNWSQPVLFRQGIEHLASSGCDVFVELSPHPVLVGAVQDVLAVNARPGRVLPSLRRGAAREALRTSLRVLRRGAAPAPIGDPDAAEGKAVRRCDGSAELLKLLRRRAAEVLQQPEATLEDDRSLPQFGLDSLMAVELRHLLEQDLGGTLSTATLLADKGLRALSQRLTVSLEVTGAAPAIVTGGAGGGEYPLSAGQKALWFLHRLAPESSAYNVSLALAFAALPDTATLRRALVRLVGRHDALSVRFQISGDEPTQRFDDIAEIDLTVHDASSWSPAELDAALQRDAHQPFHLASEVPLRTSLYRGAPAGSVLLLVLHHIVTDFWSLAILLRDLAALLRQEASGSPAALPP
ncbi:MAG: acyltransferase domain-containing protein, partial [Acidobacteriota bacterium]